MLYGLGPDRLDYVVRNVIVAMRQAVTRLVGVVSITLTGSDGNFWVLSVSATLQEEPDMLFVSIVPEPEKPPVETRQLKVIWDAVGHELDKRRLTRFEPVGIQPDGRYKVRICKEKP